MLAVRRAKHDSQFAMWLARIGNSAETSTNETVVPPTLLIIDYIFHL